MFSQNVIKRKSTCPREQYFSWEKMHALMYLKWSLRSRLAISPHFQKQSSNCRLNVNIFCSIFRAVEWKLIKGKGSRMKVNKKLYFLLKEQVETEWKTENYVLLFLFSVLQGYMNQIYDLCACLVRPTKHYRELLLP